MLISMDSNLIHCPWLKEKTGVMFDNILMKLWSTPIFISNCKIHPRLISDFNRTDNLQNIFTIFLFLNIFITTNDCNTDSWVDLITHIIDNSHRMVSIAFIMENNRVKQRVSRVYRMNHRYLHNYLPVFLDYLIGFSIFRFNLEVYLRLTGMLLSLIQTGSIGMRGSKVKLRLLFLNGDLDQHIWMQAILKDKGVVGLVRIWYLQLIIFFYIWLLFVKEWWVYFFLIFCGWSLSFFKVPLFKLFIC